MPEYHLKRHRARYTLTAAALTEIVASLADVDWRLLHWLLRYPLQRADDLVVGVARWASRATVYRHVQELAVRGLVERISPCTPRMGKWLYYLSNLGLHTLARHLDGPARELVRRWQADDAGLLAMLPRLPTLLVLQEVVNGLVTYAAEAMTTQGRRPRLVRWTWQRDVVHRFQYRDQVMRLFADGVVTLCIRTQQGDDSTLDQWYGLFLLFTELDDEQLMRLRLERLLCWRESPERWASYQHMLPVFILAATPRQRDHWQHAVETSALKLRLDPLRGALACLSQLESGRVNPWRIAWHTLSTIHPCHLGDLLRAVPPAVSPPLLDVEKCEEEKQHARALPNASGASRPSERSRHLVVGNLASRAATIMRSDLEEREVIALLGLRITPRQWSILRVLLAHPLLSDEELAAFLNLHLKSVRCSLYALHRLGCLEQMSTEVGKRWHLCQRGLRLLASANHIHIRTIAVTSDGAAGGETSTVSLRGEGWLLQHMQHTSGIYGFFAALVQAARREPGHTLCWWETGAACERRYRVGDHWYNLRPDALAEYRVGQSQIQFWLEWDRGTMNVRDLAVKFRSYAHYLASREWARERTALPRLFVVAPEVAQERRIHRVAQASLAHVTELIIWTTTVVLLHEQGPLAPIWSPGLLLPGKAAQPAGSPRRSVFEVISQEKGR